MEVMLSVVQGWMEPIITGTLRAARDGEGSGGSMIGSILAWMAPLAAACSFLGLWRSQDLSSRRLWRGVAILTALGSTTILALIALPTVAMDTAIIAASGVPTTIMYAVGLWLAISALLYEEYRRPSVRHARFVDSGLWNMITHELTSNESLDTMLLRVAAAFRRDAEADCVHVYKVSGQRQRVYRLGCAGLDASFGQSHTDENAQLLSELARWAVVEEFPVAVEGTKGTPVLTLPIRDQNTTYALMMIENPRRTSTSTWMTAAAMIGHNLAQWMEISTHRDRGVIALRLTALMPSLTAIKPLESSLSVVADAIDGLIGYDYLSISSLKPLRTHEDRATMLAASRHVLENRRGWPVTGESARRVIATGIGINTPDLEMAGDYDDNDGAPTERRLGMRSRLIVPIHEGEVAIGTITLAHRQIAAYDETDMNLLATVAAALAPWLRAREAVERRERLERVLGIVRQFHHPESDEVSMVRDVEPVLNATGMRIYRIDENRQSLGEVAASDRLRGGDRDLPLDELPWHRWAIDSRRTLYVDQGNPEAVMSAKEAAMAMDQRMKTGFLVPIVADGRPMGVIDVVERRHPERSSLDAGGRLLVERLAATLAERWSGRRPVIDGLDRDEKMSDRLKMWTRSVVNPLTCIIGSVELIRHKEPNLNSDTVKYLGTIERSATRVHDSLQTIIAEAAKAEGSETDAPTQDRSWAWARSGEPATRAMADFARPASLSEAAMRHADNGTAVMNNG